ncbi:unnamed protein product [Caenorhabditis brenneri]
MLGQDVHFQKQDVRAFGSQPAASSGNPLRFIEVPIEPPENIAQNVQNVPARPPLHLILPRHVIEEVRAHFLAMGYEVVFHDSNNNAN